MGEYLFRLLSTAFGLILGTLVSILGGYDLFLETILWFIILDIITGLIKASLNKSEKSTYGGLDSSVFRAGAVRKLFYFVAIAFAFLLQRVIGIGLRDLTIGYYIGVEGLSIVENISAAGFPIPKFLAESLDKLKQLTERSTSS